MDATAGHILIDGNTAAALGCVYAGATVGAWYPITPATSLMDAFSAFCKRFRVETATGKKRYCIVQAEDELAAAQEVLRDVDVIVRRTGGEEAPPGPFWEPIFEDRRFTAYRRSAPSR